MIGMLYPIFFLITFMYPCFWILRNIVTEKERGIRETLKTMVRLFSFPHSVGTQRFGVGVVLAHHLPLRVPPHLRGLHAHASPRLPVLQSSPLRILLLLLLLLAHDALLSHHVLLLQRQNRRTARRAHHLHHLHPQRAPWFSVSPLI